MADALQILVVEDEDDIRNLVALNLGRAGFEVLTAPDCATALALLAEHHPPVVLLDLMLPDGSGTEICAHIRRQPELASTYVIMVTARTQEEDRVEGFEVGADDYVTKPFSVKELVLRVKAAGRRVTRPPIQESGEMVRGIVRVDRGAHRVWVDGDELVMTATEYRLLLYLAQHDGRMCSRGELLEKVWDLPPSLNTRTVDTHIKRLRQKLADASAYVETVRGAGYRFQVPVDVD